MKSFEVNVEPSVMSWARRTSSLTVAAAAELTGIPEVEITYWESGAKSPTLADLRKVAKKYRRPLAAFFLPAPPERFSVPKGDFRLLPKDTDNDLSPQLAYEFRRVQMQREVTFELLELAEELAPEIDLEISRHQSAESAGNEIREWLGVSQLDQLRWKSEYEALNQWVARVESKGILVAQVSGVELEEMRGCSISDRPLPVILLNSLDAPRGRLFTLLHEVAHVLLGTGGLCDLHDDSRSQSKIGIETFCNHVAAAVLMPRDLLLHEPLVQTSPGMVEWTDSQLSRIANRYGASREALLRRFVTLNLTTRDYYVRRRAAFEQEYKEHAEKKSGGGDYYGGKLNWLGRRYAAEVLDAYRRRDISGSDAADYLDMKVNNMPQLAQRVGMDL